MRRIGLETESRTNRNNDIYLGSSVLGLQGEEKLAFSSNLDFKLSYITKRYNWDQFFKIEYGVVRLGDEDFEQSNDEWSIESLIEFKFIKYPVKKIELHPFVSGKIKSEFASNNDGILRRDVQFQNGFSISDFANFSENRIGLVHLSRLSQNEEAFGNFGIGIHSLYSSSSNIGNFSEFEFIYFFTKAKTKGQKISGAEEIAIKSFKFNFSSIFSLKNFENFSFNPSISLFAYKGEPDEGLESKWAFAVNFDFGLIFTKGWKIWKTN